MSPEPMIEGHDDPLVAELRAAFGFGTRGLGQECTQADGASSRMSPFAAVVPEPAGLAPGSRLGDFEILGEIGRGGMGVVYRARQVSLDRPVALKVLPASRQRHGASLERFLREARAAARLNHENVVPVYSHGECEGYYYYAMKLVEGVTLDLAIRSHPELLSATHASSAAARRFNRTGRATKSPAAAVEPAAVAVDDETIVPSEVAAGCDHTAQDYRHMATLLVGVAEGLAHAHDSGVVHRDIKPHNLILGQEQRLYITDFGLAYLTSEPHVTVSGEVMGTPAYLSPEQVRGHVNEIDHRTDIYSLGVTLYEMLTNSRPFQGESRDQVLHSISVKEPAPPRRRNPRVPVDLETICLRAIEKDPVRRYPSAADLAEDLRRFVDGRPILSRRAGLMERAVKFARRNRAASTALVAAVIIAAVTFGWGLTAWAAKRAEGQRLVRKAYEQLVYNDYRRPERVAAELRTAQEMKAPATALHFVRALVAMGESNQEMALAELAPVLADDPDNRQALYVLAWARWRSGDPEGSRAAFAQAEALGGAQSPEEYFFRGLAAHFDDPPLAMESYRRANLLRALNHQFFPQAMLHLARAQNQQMYANRTVDSFAETESSLRTLISNQYYEAYPYYLLSIAHRLRAEVYENSVGTRGASDSQAHFEEALRWARAGQQVDPADDRPVTAEAECLERLGRFEEALAARNRAIALADTAQKRCEGLHFRWRLHYWLGDYPAALADIGEHAACMPGNLFYRYVYPALVAADMGDMATAQRHAEALVAAAGGGQSPNEVDTMSRTILAAGVWRLLGRPAQAAELLAAEAPIPESSTETTAWQRALWGFSADRVMFDELVTIATESPKPWKLMGEAWFHAGLKSLAAGDRSTAAAALQQSYQSFDSALGFSFHSRILVIKLSADPQWPSWIPSVPAAEQLPFLLPGHSGGANVLSSDEGED